MTETQLAQARALERCKFSPGSTEKRFVRFAAFNASNHPEFELSPKAATFLNELAHSYRKQIGRCMATECAKCDGKRVNVLGMEMTPLNERTRKMFEHVRREVWLDALGPKPHDPLVEMQKRMPGWPRLFAFHLWCAAVMLTTNNNEDQGFAVFMDQWLERSR
ncbi:MAG TPA: hypothetical protein VGG74_21410 [Kofleriaceae bacterium]